MLCAFWGTELVISTIYVVVVLVLMHAASTGVLENNLTICGGTINDNALRVLCCRSFIDTYKRN